MFFDVVVLIYGMKNKISCIICRFVKFFYKRSYLQIEMLVILLNQKFFVSNISKYVFREEIKIIIMVVLWLYIVYEKYKIFQKIYIILRIYVNINIFIVNYIYRYIYI